MTLIGSGLERKDLKVEKCQHIGLHCLSLGTNLNPFGLSRGIESYKNRVWTRVEQLGKKLQLQCGERVVANHHRTFSVFIYLKVMADVVPMSKED